MAGKTAYGKWRESDANGNAQLTIIALIPLAWQPLWRERAIKPALGGNL